MDIFDAGFDNLLTRELVSDIPDSSSVFDKINPSDIDFSDSSFVKSLKYYDAIIDLTGDADYKDIQSAIDDSKTRIFLRNGTYKITDNINLPDGCALVGEDKNGTILDFGATDGKYIRVVGDSDAYTTGTVSISNNSTALAGSSTVWSTNVAADEWVYLGGSLYQISSVTNNTTIVLKKAYQGKALSGATYLIAAYKSNILLENFSVINTAGSTSGQILLDYVRDSIVRNVKSKVDQLPCIQGDGAINNIIRDNNFDGSFYGVRLDNSSHHNTISGNKINNCVNDAISLVGGNYNIVVNNDLNNAAGDGINIDSDYNKISQNSVTFCNTTGIDLNGDENIIVNNQLNNNTDNIDDAGTNNIIDMNLE
uniref:Periplasmic copper-binding protein NosD beta helix domain-containing protein n=1 Tax=viral metagenome TaxID=1070528 RepID=A0A6H1ZGA7_9ZZZZ